MATFELLAASMCLFSSRDSEDLRSADVLVPSNIKNWKYDNDTQTTKALRWHCRHRRRRRLDRDTEIDQTKKFWRMTSVCICLYVYSMYVCVCV